MTYQTSNNDVNTFSNIIISPSEDWKTWTSADNQTVKTQFGHTLRSEDYLYQIPDGKLLRAKKPKPGALISQLTQAYNEIFGNYISENLGISVKPTYLIKQSQTEFTIGSVATTGYTVQDVENKVLSVDISKIDESQLKKNYATRIFLHDPDANPGHICIVLGDQIIEPYFVDFASCFTGHGGENYTAATNGLGNPNVNLWGSNLIQDFTDPIVLSQIEKIEGLSTEELEAKSKKIVEQITLNIEMSQEDKRLVEETRVKSLELLKYRMINIRPWIEQLKPRK